MAELLAVVGVLPGVSVGFLSAQSRHLCEVEPHSKHFMGPPLPRGDTLGVSSLGSELGTLIARSDGLG